MIGPWWVNLALGMGALVIALEIVRSRRQRPKPAAEVIPSPQQQEAGDYGIDYEIDKFWPPAAYIYDRVLVDHGLKVWVRDMLICPEMYVAQVGDLVPVYEDEDGNSYWYVVTGFSWAPGDDHIWSPKQFHLKYWERRTPDEDNSN